MLCRGAYSFIPLCNSTLSSKANGSGDQARFPTIYGFVLAEGNCKLVRNMGERITIGESELRIPRRILITPGPVDRVLPKLAPSKLSFFETNTDPINGCFL